MEDFTTYTEVDPGDDITVTSSKVDLVSAVSRTDTFHVYKDFGVNHFNVDFLHQFEIEFSSVGFETYNAFWSIANSIKDLVGITNDNEDGMFFDVYDSNEGLSLRVVENGTPVVDQWLSPGPQAGILYFVTIERDDDGGVNNTGQLTAKIRTGSHAGALQDTLSVDCSAGEQNDFRYLFAANSFDDNGNANTISAFVQNLRVGLEIVVNSASHIHTADSPAIIQILSILAVNDSSHVHTASSPTLQLIFDLLVNDASHTHTADSPLLIVYLAVLDAIHTMSADSPVLEFIPAETLRTIYTGKVPGVNYTAAVPKVQLTGRAPGVEFK